MTATGFDIHENDIDSVGNIGRGIGLVTWVVELSGDRLAAIGAIGKLWLEGPLVAQGYLGEPEKTKVSFIDNPPWLLREVSGT